VYKLIFGVYLLSIIELIQTGISFPPYNHFEVPSFSFKMRYNPTANTTYKISCTRDVVRKATFEALLSFRVSTWKKVAEAKEMNYSDLYSFVWKTLYRTAHVKNGSNSFEREISTFKIVNALVNQLVGSKGRDSYKMLQPDQTITSELYQQHLICVNDTKKDRLMAVGEG